MPFSRRKKKVKISPFPYLEYIAMACSLLFNIYICIGRTCRGFVLLSGLPKERAHLCNKLFQSWSPPLNYPLTIPLDAESRRDVFLVVQMSPAMRVKPGEHKCSSVEVHAPPAGELQVINLVRSPWGSVLVKSPVSK